MKISLENYLRNKLDEVESLHSFELATDTIRCWIDEYNEQLCQYNVVRQSEQLNCEHEWKVEGYDCYGFPISKYCEKCDVKEAI